ncbi:MAG: YfiR family protein [Halieaceae bacterium]
MPLSSEKSGEGRHLSTQPTNYRVKLLKISALSFFSLFFCGYTSNTHGDQTRYADFELKAAFILNFPAFISWPQPNDNTKHVICSFSDDAVADSIETLLASTRMKQRKAKISFLRDPGTNVHCDLAFVGKKAKEHIDEISTPINSLQTLVVSDIPSYAAAGGMMELALDGSNIKVIMNHAVMNARGFKVDSRLRQLTEQVSTSTAQEVP